MWKEVFDGETVVERVTASYFPDDGESNDSRRVSAASDDSFDASSYVHVENKLNSKMPKCLLNDGNTNPSVDNHFSKVNNTKTGNDVTKNGKRVMRKRLSISEFNATRFSPKNVNNNNANNHDIVTSSSSDSDTLPKTEKKSKNVLSAKIQHLLFEMKRLRQLDRDILRKFLVINDTIEEQRWLVEEKQEAIKRSLSEEGDDPVTLNFDTVREVPEEPEDDEESIHSVLSRQNSSSNRSESFSNDDIISPTEKESNETIPTSKKTLESDLASTSSDSALSMSGGSSTLSSTTSLPVSNRSLSPPTSHSFIKSSSTDTSSHNDKKTTSASQLSTQSHEEDYAGDIEGYYRMYGASMKRGSYPFPRQAQSFDAGHFYASKSHHYDDGALDSAYSTRRSSKDSDSRDAAEYARAVRMNAVNRSYAAQYRTDADAQPKPRPRSASTSNELKIENRNRAQRISVRPDGTHDTQIGISSRHSFSDKPSAAYRLMHHPSHQRHLTRMNMTRQLPHMSFVPIAEQEPDVMYENGRLYSNDSDCGSKFENRIENTNQRQVTRNLRQCPPVMRKPSASGSAGSLTSSSSRTSTSSLASSGSNSSLPSPTKFATNEVAEYFVRQKVEPVWVQRRPHTVKTNDYVIPYNNKAFPTPYAPKYSAPAQHVTAKPQVEKARFIPTKRANSYRPKAENERVLTVSYKPTNKGANQAVYNWIQTQDDVTYL